MWGGTADVLILTSKPLFTFTVQRKSSSGSYRKTSPPTPTPPHPSVTACGEWCVPGSRFSELGGDAAHQPLLHADQQHGLTARQQPLLHLAARQHQRHRQGLHLRRRHQPYLHAGEQRQRHHRWVPAPFAFTLYRWAIAVIGCVGLTRVILDNTPAFAR